VQLRPEAPWPGRNRVRSASQVQPHARRAFEIIYNIGEFAQGNSFLAVCPLQESGFLFEVLLVNGPHKKPGNSSHHSSLEGFYSTWATRSLPCTLVGIHILVFFYRGQCTLELCTIWPVLSSHSYKSQFRTLLYLASVLPAQLLFPILWLYQFVSSKNPPAVHPQSDRRFTIRFIAAS